MGVCDRLRKVDLSALPLEDKQALINSAPRSSRQLLMFMSAFVVVGVPMLWWHATRNARCAAHRSSISANTVAGARPPPALVCCRLYVRRREHASHHALQRRVPQRPQPAHTTHRALLQLPRRQHLPLVGPQTPLSAPPTLSPCFILFLVLLVHVHVLVSVVVDDVDVSS